MKENCGHLVAVFFLYKLFEFIATDQTGSLKYTFSSPPPFFPLRYSATYPCLLGISCFFCNQIQKFVLTTAALNRCVRTMDENSPLHAVVTTCADLSSTVSLKPTGLLKKPEEDRGSVFWSCSRIHRHIYSYVNPFANYSADAALLRQLF